MLIGIHGRLGSGKDTVCERMAALGIEPVRFGFADKLKISAMASLGMRSDAFGNRRTDQELIDLANILKEHGTIAVSVDGVQHFTITGRQYLQFKGTEGGRDVFGDDFWVDMALSGDLGSGLDRTFVCTDVRFENEAKTIIERGGQVWRVVGPDEDTGDHPSEVPLPDHFITATIDNTVRDDGFSFLDTQIRTLLGR